MAQSFWSRRRDTYDNASSYMRATEEVSRPTAILMGMLAVFAVVALLFGVFWGARMAYSKLTGRDNTASVATNKTTVTSSTSTSTSNAKTTPTPTPTPTPTTTNSSNTSTSSSSSSITNTGPSSLPNTGPTSLVD